MTVDATTRAFLDQLASATTKPRHEMTVEDAREGLRKLRGLLGDGPKMLRVDEFEVPVDDGSAIRVRLLVPDSDPSGLLVYFHGGGWVVGSIDEFDPLGRELAAGAGCAVAMVNYRKAPEYPYPTPVEDAWDALNWCADNIKMLVGRDVPLFVGGDSAGGNLAIVMTHRARDRQGPRIDGQLLAYPVTDSDLHRAGYLDPENQLMLTAESMTIYWDRYFPDRTHRTDPEASPLRARSLRSLPPAIILIAEYDVLREEGEAYACALADSGVPVVQRCFDGQMHAFLMMIDLFPASKLGIDFATAQLRVLLDETSGRPESPKGAENGS